MNVLISALHTDSKISGVGNYSINLINQLVEQQPDDQFFVLVNKHLKGAIKNYPNLQAIEINHIDSLLGTIKKHLFHYLSLEEYASQYNADVIHVLNPILLKRRSIPIIVTVHDLAELYIKKYNIFRQIYRVFSTYRSCKSSTKIISISKNTRKDLINKFKIDQNKIDVIYQSFGVDPTVKKPLESNKYQEYPYFLFVGKGLPHKNLNTVLESFFRYKQVFDNNLRLVIVGDGNKKIVESFQNYSEVEHAIVIKGYVSNEELQSLYRNCFCFLIPSIYEGFGLPLVEAMHYRVPIISSNAACLPEITHGKVLFHDPTDVDMLKECMIKITDSKGIKENMISKYPEILESYSWEKTAKKTFEVYCDVIKE